MPVWILVCALTTPLNGSGDDRIYCFKPDGPIGLKGLDVLREMRAREKACDGREDIEESGLSEDEETELDLEHIEEDEPLVIESDW